MVSGAAVLLITPNCTFTHSQHKRPFPAHTPAIPTNVRLNLNIPFLWEAFLSLPQAWGTSAIWASSTTEQH